MDFDLSVYVAQSHAGAVAVRITSSEMSQSPSYSDRESSDSENSDAVTDTESNSEEDSESDAEGESDLGDLYTLFEFESDTESPTQARHAGHALPTPGSSNNPLYPNTQLTAVQSRLLVFLRHSLTKRHSPSYCTYSLLICHRRPQFPNQFIRLNKILLKNFRKQLLTSITTAVAVVKGKDAAVVLLQYL